MGQLVIGKRERGIALARLVQQPNEPGQALRLRGGGHGPVATGTALRDVISE
jgi:hypothetical protein